MLCTVGACLPPCLLKSSTLTGQIKARPKSPSRDEAASSKKSKAFHYSNNHEAEMFEPRSLHTKKTCTISTGIMAIHTKTDRENPFWQKVVQQRWLLPLASLFLFLGVWQLLYTVLGLPPFILPSYGMDEISGSLRQWHVVA